MTLTPPSVPSTHLHFQTHHQWAGGQCNTTVSPAQGTRTEWHAQCSLRQKPQSPNALPRHHLLRIHEAGLLAEDMADVDNCGPEETREARLLEGQSLLSNHTQGNHGKNHDLMRHQRPGLLW